MSQWWVIQLWKKSGWDKKKLAVESWHIVAHCNHYNQQPGSERLGQAQPSTSPLSHPLIKESKLLEPVLPHCKNATWCSWQSRAKIREQWCQSWSKSRQVKQLKPSIIFKESSDKKKRPRVKNVHSMLAKNFAWTRIRFRNIISNQTTRIPWRSSRRKKPRSCGDLWRQILSLCHDYTVTSCHLYHQQPTCTSYGPEMTWEGQFDNFFNRPTLAVCHYQLFYECWWHLKPLLLHRESNPHNSKT